MCQMLAKKSWAAVGFILHITVMSIYLHLYNIHIYIQIYACFFILFVRMCCLLFARKFALYPAHAQFNNSTTTCSATYVHIICLCIYFCACVEAHLCLYFITSLFHYKYRYIDMPVCGCAAAFFMRVQAHNNLLYVCKIFLFIPIYMPMNVLKRMHRFASLQRNL